MLVPKTYELLYRCLEDGIAMGYTRAFKHDSRPSEDTIKEHIHREVMNEINEWFSIKDVTVGVIDE
jgi:hypothetical protein